MDLAPPVKCMNGSYNVVIHSAEHLHIQYPIHAFDSHTSPDNDMDTLKRYLIDLGTNVNVHMNKWLSQQINVTSFLKFVSNIWDFGNKPLYNGNTNGTIYVKQIWCPDKISIQTNLYSVYWKLLEVVYFSEEATLISGEESEIPFAPEDNVLKIKTSLREILKERIRRYRLLATMYETKVNRLKARYYERYGITEISDNG